jgi:UDP-N-acetylmuramyl pentapeptide phosphotransferase/UDP-N-acetylglucosamine-1-phosphate transferase
MRWGRLLVENHRGVPVPRVLGMALAIDAVVWTLVVATITDVGAAGWGALAGLLLVFGAGLIDDLAPPGPRGLRNHLRSVASGRATTGLIKVVVIVGSAVVVVALQPDRETSVAVLGVVLLSGSANVWNDLDVVPGRSLKAFVLPALAFAIWGEQADAPAVVGLLVGAVALLPFDLRESAMLGDGGANLLGFAAGIALYDVLPDPWVVVAAGVAAVLNVLGETVSFSRMIERTPPLRWVDGLGRRD